jgi:hypothetical protein
MRIANLTSAGAALLLAALLQPVGHCQVYQTATTPALRYFGSRQANPGTIVEQPALGGRGFVQGHQQLQVAGGKPFEYVQRQSTLSPYLALDAVPESNTSLPNWHLFVQPLMQQRNAGEARARELVRARQKMRVASARHIVPETPPAGVPITGSSTQFLNMGSYFPGAR